MNKLTIGSLLLLFSTAFAIPKAIAQTPNEPDNTRVEKYEDLTQPESPADVSQSDMDSMEMKQGEGMEMEKPQGAEPPSTRTEETLDEAQSGDMQSGSMMMGSDVRRTEAFNLVSSAYRGDFEKQGIDGYQVLISDYETGKITADDIIKAGIDSGELSPKAMEDDSYVDAVNSQLMSLTNR